MARGGERRCPRPASPQRYGVPPGRAGCRVAASPAPQPLCFLPLAEVFLPEETRAAAPVDFLQELPSYQSALRRRAAAGGTQERRAAPPGAAGFRAAEAGRPEQEDGEVAARPAREYPLSIAEKRRLRLIFTCYFPFFFKKKITFS